MTSSESAKSYSITLERGADGTYLAWVDDLPGCAVRAGSREDALHGLPSAISEFLEWAGAAEPGVPSVSVTEEVDSVIEAEEDTEVIVASDRAPLTNEEWSRIERWLSQSRIELTKLLDGLGDDELDLKREGSERTLREEIEHVGFVEFMYAAWTFDLQSREGLVEFLTWARALSAERLRTLAKRRASTATWADWAGASRLEAWTPRKAARRLVWHELLHLRAIERFRV